MSKILLLVSLFLKGRLKYFKLVSKLQSSPKLKFGGLCNFTLLFITENSFERKRKIKALRRESELNGLLTLISS